MINEFEEPKCNGLMNIIESLLEACFDWHVADQGDGSKIITVMSSKDLENVTVEPKNKIEMYFTNFGRFNGFGWELQRGDGKIFEGEM